MNVEDKLARYIAYKFKTQKEFCKAANIPMSTLSTILRRGILNTTTDKLFAICDTLGIVADELAKGKIIPKNNDELENLSIDEQELIDIYDQLSKRSKDVVMRTAEDLLDIEQNKTTLILPMINQPKPKITEIDYYDQAAGMGTGQIVDYPMPEKIKLLSSQIPKDADFIIRVYGDSMEPTFHSNDKLFIHSTHVLDVGDIGVFSLNGEQLVKEYGRGKLISHNKEYEPIKIDENVYIQGKVVGKV